VTFCVQWYVSYKLHIHHSRTTPRSTYAINDNRIAGSDTQISISPFHCSYLYPFHPFGPLCSEALCPYQSPFSCSCPGHHCSRQALHRFWVSLCQHPRPCWALPCHLDPLSSSPPSSPSATSPSVSAGILTRKRTCALLGGAAIAINAHKPTLMQSKVQLNAIPCKLSTRLGRWPHLSLGFQLALGSGALHILELHGVLPASASVLEPSRT